MLGSAIIGQTVLGFALAWTLRDGPRRGPRRIVETLVLLAWILPSRWSRSCGSRCSTATTARSTRCSARRGFAWLVEHPMLSIIVFNTWRGTAFSMMLFSAPRWRSCRRRSWRPRGWPAPSGWQQLRDVVFPHIRGHVLTNTLLISLWTFNDFTPVPAHRRRPEPARRRSCRSTSTTTALNGGELGYGAAISLIMLLINLVIALVYLRAAATRRAHMSHRSAGRGRIAGGRQSPWSPGRSSRVLFYVLIALITAFFALPMLWLVLAPFDATPDATPSRARTSRCDNFRGAAATTRTRCASLLQLALISRWARCCSCWCCRRAGRLRAVPGAHPRPRRAALPAAAAVSIVTGTAAMVPIFLLMFQLDLIDRRLGVVLVLTGGLLPAAIFILKDFMDAIAALVRGVGAGVRRLARCRSCAHVVMPVARPGPGDDRGVGDGATCGATS